MLITVVSVLATSLANAEQPTGDESIRVRTFSKSDVVDRLRRAGILDEPTGLARLPKADGVRIILSSGELVEIWCDGRLDRHPLPPRKTYFDSEGRPFAWMEGQKLRFREASAEHEVGNQISVDPNGNYLVTTDGPKPNRETRIYATRHLASPLGRTPLAGSHTRVFSSDAESIVVLGDVPGSRGAVVAIVYDLRSGGFVERERIDVPAPDTWFGGWLVAEDATPDANEISFGFWRDPPFPHQLYVFDMRMRKLRHVSRLSDFHAYVACDPIGAH